MTVDTERALPEPVRVSRLVKTYGSAPPAVDDLSFEVRPGEVVALLGPNGAGKSTTVGCISGLLRPDGGSIELVGEPISSAPRSLRGRIGVAAQDVSLYTDLTARQNLVHFGRLAGLGARTVDRAVRRVATLLGIRALLDRRVRELSGGQQRSVHVACAAVHRPSLLILDEPTAGLDARARAAVLELVADVRASGSGVLYSSHHLHEVEELCDRVVIVAEGRMVAEGTVAELVERHGDAVVEVEVAGVVHERAGTDVAAAVAELAALGPIDDVRVRRPSLEAVFLDLTGDADDEVAS